MRNNSEGRIENMTEENVFNDAATILDKLFVNRRDAYALQQKNGAYYRVEEPISTDVIKKHLTGEHTIGVYQLDHDETVKWFCINIDLQLTDNHIIECANETNTMFKEMINNLFERFKYYGIPISLEYNGNQGYNIWAFLNQKVSDHMAFEVCFRLVKKALYMPYKPYTALCEQITITISPKHISHSDQYHYNNIVMLPLGIHRITNQRSYFCNEKLHPYQDDWGKMLIPQTNYLKFIGSH